MRDPKGANSAAADFQETEITRGNDTHRTELGLRTASSTFREYGLWAIDSANANSWSSLYQLLVPLLRMLS